MWVGVYGKPVAHIAIMGLFQVPADYSTDDLFVTDEGNAVTCPVIGVNVRYFQAYKIVDQCILLLIESLGRGKLACYANCSREERDSYQEEDGCAQPC